MDTIVAHISHLLWRDSYVGIPYLGVLRLVECSSRFEGAVLKAPTVDIVFDSNEEADGEALFASVSRADVVSMDDARTLVLGECRALADRLMSGENIDMPGIGSFTAEAATGAFVFTPSSVHNWLPDLTPVAIEETVPAKPEIGQAFEALEQRREALARSLRRTASSAAAIAVFALLAFVVSQLPSRKGASRPQMASVGIETISAVQNDDEPLIITPGAKEHALVLILNTPADGTAPAKQRYRKVQETKEHPDAFCLIVASLGTRAEAMSYIEANSTEELPLHLLAENGRLRVYALSGASYEELASRAKALDVYKAYPTAWICRR